MNEVLEHIKNNTYKNIYIFYGKEKYLVNFYIQKLLDGLLQKSTRAMNYDIFDEKTINAEKFKESIDTLPIFSDKRVIYLKNIGISDKKNKNVLDILIQCIKSMPREICIIIEEEEIEKDAKWLKNINDKSITEVINCEIQSESTLIKWIQKKLKEAGKKIEAKVAAYMLRKVGFNMINIISEIQKLIDYSIQSSEITTRDIDEICIESIESKIFDLLNEIGRRNVAKAMEIYFNLIHTGEPIQRIIYMIARQFIIISDVKLLKEKGYSADEIAKLTQSPRFAVSEYLKQIDNFSHKALKVLLQKCLSIDIDTKKGNIDPKTALELLILEAARK